MVNANLDAGYPVLLGIKRSSGYHSIVGDGYGNQWGAWYHHLNMGWGGSQNLWYNLPNIDAANPPYNTVCDTVYNIYTSGAGEIISGRVTNSCGSPVGGATVTASGPGSPPAVTTSASGIFAFPKVAANASYTIHVNGTGYTDQVVTTGESLDGTLDTGNRWGVNFVANRAPVAPEYVLYSLGGLDLKASNAYAINNNGSIVGGMKVNNSYLNNNPCIWREGEKGQFGFYRVGSDVVDYGELLGINDNGDLAVGYAYKSTWPSGTQELPIYLDWFMNFGYLQVPSTPSPYGRAYGVNNSDQIVGNTSMESNDISACLWPNRTTMAQRIDNLGGTAGTTQTLANRINNAGKIVGKYYGGISIRAFFWDGANVNWLGPASGNSEACSLNNLNSPTVVGLTGTRGYVGTRAVIFNGAAIQELSNTDSTALGVNGQGQIVGSSKFGSRSHAFIYDSQAGLRDLNALLNEPDWELVTANDINDNGEIVGSGWYKCIIQFAYMLRPLYTITATAGAGGTIAPSGAVKVIRGEDITFKILPNASYRIVDVLVDGVSQGPIGIYTFTNVTANHTIAATFTGGTTYTITANAGNGGSITPSGSVAVNGGGSQNFKITASPGYRIADVKVDNVSQGAISSYTFSNVTANHTIAASFTPGATTYNIVASAGSGGSISPSGTVTLNAGDSQTFTITANSGYQIADVKVDNVSQGAISSYTFSNVTGNHTIAASFSTGPATYTINASAGSGGSISPSGTVTVNSGGSQSFTITANSGYQIGDVKVDNVSQGAISNYTFSSVTANHTIAASFTAVGATYTITASAASGGSISPSGTVTVNSGGSQTFTITPASGYQINDVLVDGSSQGPLTSYTFANVTMNHTISANFNKLGGAFFDHFEGDHLGSAWIVKNPDTANYSISNSRLHTKTLPGDLYQGSNDYKNLFLISNPLGKADAQVTIRVSGFDSTDNYQQIFVTAYDDDDNYVRVCNVFSNGRKWELCKEVGGGYSYNQDANGIIAKDFYLRLVKTGNTYRQYSSQDGVTYRERNSAITYGNGVPQYLGLIALEGDGKTATPVPVDLDFFAVETPGNPNPVFFDHFSGGSLSSPWIVRNPDTANYSVSDSKLHTRTMSGDIHLDANNYKNLFLIPNPVASGGDFQLTIKVTGFEPVENYQQIILLAFDDDDHHVRAGNGYYDGRYWEFSQEVGSFYAYSHDSKGITVSDFYLRLTKTGNTYKQYTSLNGVTYEQRNRGATLTFGDGNPKYYGFIAFEGSGVGAAPVPVDIDFFSVEAPGGSAQSLPGIMGLLLQD